jgi:hypothetical protein
MDLAQPCNGNIASSYVDCLIDEINDRMSDSISGYQLVVNLGGNLYHQESRGFAIHPNDEWQFEEMTNNTRLNVASVSKFVGTLALIIALDEKNIDLDDNVIPHLPEDWKPRINEAFSNPDSAAYLTFRKLLLNQTAIDFPGAPATPGDGPGAMITEAQMLQGLINDPNFGRIGTYQNANFTLIRVIIGEIIYNLQTVSIPPPLIPYSIECTERYFEFIKTRIFDKINVNAPLTPGAIENYYSIDYPLAYQFPFDPNWRDGDNNLGWRHSNNDSPYRNGGSGGLVLSSLDIAKLLAFFRHDPMQSIVTTAQRDLILNEQLGLWESLTGAYGTYPSKQGQRGLESATGRGIVSRIVFFPDAIEVVLLTNSGVPNLGQILRSSYDAARDN